VKLIYTFGRVNQRRQGYRNGYYYNMKSTTLHHIFSYIYASDTHFVQIRITQTDLQIFSYHLPAKNDQDEAGTADD